MSDARIGTAILAAPFVILAVIFLIAETVRLIQVNRKPQGGN